MKFNFILNANSPLYLVYLQQMQFFIEKFKSHCDIGKVYIVVDESIYIKNNLKSLQDEITLIVQKNHDIEALIQYLSSNVIIKDEIYLFSHDLTEMGVMERVAYRLNASSCSDIVDVDFVNQNIQLKKMVYANNLEAIFSLKKYPYLISLDKIFAKSKSDLVDIQPIVNNSKVIIEEINTQNNDIKCIDITADKSENELLSAKVVVVIGFGVHDKKLINKVKLLADKLNAVVAGSRPVIMNALLPMGKLIGVSGNIIQPEICIVLGASGAPAFYAGIEKSKYIVSINNDMNATIMKKSDLILVDDIDKILDVFIEKYCLEEGII